MVDPVICVVTPGSLERAHWSRFLEDASAAAGAGATLIQIREPTLETGLLFELVTLSVEAVRGTATRVIVNDRLDVALAAGAHGVHLRGDSMPASRARLLSPRGFLVGRSIRGVDDARAGGERDALDYIVFGTVFPTSSKPGVMAAGTDLLAAVVAATTVPVVAVGGMTVDRLADVAAAGAAGFAAISLFQASSPAQVGSIVRMARAAFVTPA